MRRYVTVLVYLGVRNSKQLKCLRSLLQVQKLSQCKTCLSLSLFGLKYMVLLISFPFPPKTKLKPAVATKESSTLSYISHGESTSPHYLLKGMLSLGYLEEQLSTCWKTMFASCLGGLLYFSLSLGLSFCCVSQPPLDFCQFYKRKNKYRVFLEYKMHSFPPKRG